MKQIFLHLGIHKTATKFLQEDIFPRLNDIDYLEKAKYERSLLDSLLHQDVLTFNYRKDKIREAFLGMAESDKLPLLISNELFYGNIFFNNNNRNSLLLKLKSLFPNAKILISIRGQRQMIDSIYREYIVQGGCGTVDEFLSPKTPKGKSILSYNPSLDPESLKYGKYLDAVSELFGIDNCCFLPYEILVKDSKTYLTKILTFLGSSGKAEDFTKQKRHGSMSNRALKFLRIMNKFHYSAMHSSGALPNSLNIGHFLRRMKVGQFSREKSAAFKFELPVDYTDDNNYIDQKYKLNLKEKFSEYYFI
jgi:hypothetical protein